MDALEFPELHEESVGVLAFTRNLYKLMLAAGVTDFSLKVGIDIGALSAQNGGGSGPPRVKRVPASMQREQLPAIKLERELLPWNCCLGSVAQA